VSIPQWNVTGDWFDTCKCSIPCPCYFAQPPTTGDCEGVLAWHVRVGKYGDVGLDGLNVIALGSFVGNIWAGAKATMGIFIDERGDERQRHALQMIFGGRAGGWPGLFAQTIAEVRGLDFAPITFEVADDLAYWRAAIPGKVLASAEALTGPTSLPGTRVQVHNPPVRKSVQARSRPRVRRPRTKLPRSGLIGSGSVDRASTCDSTGRDRKVPEQRLYNARWSKRWRLSWSCLCCRC